MTASSSTFPFPMQKENKWCFLQSFLQIDIISYRLSEFHYTYIVHLTKLSKIMARLGLYGLINVKKKISVYVVNLMKPNISPM